MEGVLVSGNSIVTNTPRRICVLARAMCNHADLSGNTIQTAAFPFLSLKRNADTSCPSREVRGHRATRQTEAEKLKAQAA